MWCVSEDEPDRVESAHAVSQWCSQTVESVDAGPLTAALRQQTSALMCFMHLNCEGSDQTSDQLQVRSVTLNESDEGLLEEILDTVAGPPCTLRREPAHSLHTEGSTRTVLINRHFRFINKMSVQRTRVLSCCVQLVFKYLPLLSGPHWSLY